MGIDYSRSAICVFFSEGKGVEGGVCFTHDLQYAICIYFNWLKGYVLEYLTLKICDLHSFTSVGVEASVIHDLGSSICVYVSWCRGICYSRSPICNLHSFQWKKRGVLVEVSVIHNLRSAICIYFSRVEG